MESTSALQRSQAHQLPFPISCLQSTTLSLINGACCHYQNARFPQNQLSSKVKGALNVFIHGFGVAWSVRYCEAFGVNYLPPPLLGWPLRAKLACGRPQRIRSFF